MRFAACSCSRLEDFRSVERQDPIGSAVHLCVAVAWAASVAIGRVPEGVLWGVLVVIAVVRVHRTWHLYYAMFASRPWRWLALVWLWGLLVILWSPEWPDSALEWLKFAVPRAFFIVPMVWPLLHRWRMLVWALAIGAGVAALASVANVQLISHRYSAGLLADVGVAAAVAIMVHSSSIRVYFWGLLACGAVEAQLALMQGRAAFLASGAAIIAILARPLRKPGVVPNWLTAAAMVVVGVGVLALGGGSMVKRFGEPFKLLQQERATQVQGESKQLTPAQIQAQEARVSRTVPTLNVRIVLWRIAWERSLERPLLGHGHGAWKPAVRQAVSTDPTRYGADVIGEGWLAVTPPPHAHNVLFDQVFTKGLIGLVFFLGLLACLWRRTWAMAGHDAARTAMLGILAAWCVGATMTGADQITIGVCVLSLLTLAASVVDD